MSNRLQLLHTQEIQRDLKAPNAFNDGQKDQIVQLQ